MPTLFSFSPSTKAILMKATSLALVGAMICLQAEMASAGKQGGNTAEDKSTFLDFCTQCMRALSMDVFRNCYPNKPIIPNEDPSQQCSSEVLQFQAECRKRC